MNAENSTSLFRRVLSPRIVTALVGIPLVAFVVWWGGWPFNLLVTLLAFLALRELQIAVRNSEYGAAGWRVWSLVGYVAIGASIWLDYERLPAPLWSGVLAAVLLGLCVVFYRTRERVNSSLNLGTVAMTTLATGYVGLFALFPVLRELENGKWFWLTLICVWSCDTLAYFAGRALGRRKVTSLSPGKTLEGFIGGWLGAIIAGVLVAYFAGLPLGHGAILGAVLGIVTPIGDLAESFWKRELGVKDLGALFPGHGGVLDRTDSLLFAVLASLICVSILRS